MNKQQLREKYLLQRKSLSKSELIRISKSITASLFSYFDFSQINSVHCYLSIQKQNEIDASGIIENLRLANVKIAISKSNFDTMQLDNYWFTEDTKLKLNKVGVPEPINGVKTGNPYDLIITPLLIFDRKGNRIGYGKGFYDRFLATAPNTIKVGLCCFEPVNKIPEIDKLDIALDYCITPESIYNFTS
jgi:5-formyltetrahydrofolate cyclo-ligase